MVFAEEACGPRRLYEREDVTDMDNGYDSDAEKSTDGCDDMGVRGVIWQMHQSL